MKQTLRRGAGCIRELATLIRESGARRVLILHGRASFEASGVREVLASVQGVDYRFFADVPANPELATVRRCLELFISTSPEAVLAVGGGSVIDTAKAAIAFSSGATEGDILANRFEPGAARPHFWAAPTTAGSGSEATHFAVLYKDGKKYSLAHPELKPDLVFLDPALTSSCPPGLTLASGADAVCQAVESWWNKSASVQSRSYALEALDLLLANLFRSVENPDSLEIRGAMLEGAHLAGKAIDLTKTTAGHAMSYGLTGAFGLPHGLAVLAVMGPLVKFMDERFSFFDSCPELDRAFAIYGKGFVEGFRVFHDKVFFGAGLAKTSTYDAVGATLAETLAKGVNIERLSNHPVRLGTGDITVLYKNILSDLGIVSHKEGIRQ